MESIFELSEGDRTAYLHQMSYSFACTYICLWSYDPSNCLVFMDGVYHEEYIDRAISSSSSSTTSLPSRLFYQYQKSVFSVDDSHRVPGVAFKNSIPYLEYKGLELQTLTSTEVQLQFYQEARIKTCTFMGCKSGEIELGFSIDSQVNVEAQMKNLFPQDFSLQVVPRDLTQPTDHQTVPPSFSPSLMVSLPIHSSSTAPSPFINVTSTSHNPHPTLQQPLPPALISTPSTNYAFQETIDTLNQIRNINFPTIESEDAAITQAILAVISSSTSPSPTSSPSSPQPQQRISTSAFKSYRRSVLAPSSQITKRFQRPNMLKLAVEFIRGSSSLMRGQERTQTGSRSGSNQLQHMIKERKRRERLNQNFEALRSLLPPGSKKDKASVLNSTLEYMNLLIAEVEELNRRNKMLLSQHHDQANARNNQEIIGTSSLSSINTADQRLDIRISNVAETTSESSVLDLRVRIRGECSISDITIRVLEFLRQVANVGLLSVEASTQMVGTAAVTDFVWRLKIEGDENWEESTFLEAVRRVIDDLAQ
ncbi:putative transcription factor bHLH041 [Heracleum sosnowskyi]|uniref:Transcription factor bHLH041 n=1 Tax=Heracleum sosnowskyi TaxID=360622 RepID=A0AAD8I2H9_9APIA|nr:putative transcription factor bHLH041 [Heracleum sosnowskyi]